MMCTLRLRLISGATSTTIRLFRALANTPHRTIGTANAGSSTQGGFRGRRRVYAARLLVTGVAVGIGVAYQWHTASAAAGNSTGKTAIVKLLQENGLSKDKIQERTIRAFEHVVSTFFYTVY